MFFTPRLRRWLQEGSLGALLLLAAWPIHLTLENADHQIANLLCFFAIALGSLLLFSWLLRTFVKSWWKRLAVVFVLVCVAFQIGKQLEVRGFSGEMLPQVRWKSARAKQLVAIEPASPPTAVPSTGSTAVSTTGDVNDPASKASHEETFNQFMGNHRDGRVDGPSIQSNWSANPPEIIWQTAVGAGWSGFAAADGLAITQEQHESGEAVIALNLLTGRLAWRSTTPRKHYHPLGGAGPRATPSVEREQVLAQSSTGIVTSMELRTGKINWSVDLLLKAGIDQSSAEAAVSWGRSGSPLVVGDLVVVPLGAGLNRTSPTDAASLIALDLVTGEERWRAGESQISYASPALMTLGDREQIVVVNEADVTGHDPQTGVVLWKTDWPGVSNGGANVSQATRLDSTHLLLSKGYGGGSKLLEFQAAFTFESEIRTVWNDVSLMKSKFMSPVVLGKYVYGLSDGILECIRWEDGERMWKDSRQGRLGHGQLLLIGDQLLCSSEDGRLVLTQATPKKPTSYESLSLLEEITWNPLAIVGDLVIVRNAEKAVCVRVGR